MKFSCDGRYRREPPSPWNLAYESYFLPKIQPFFNKVDICICLNFEKDGCICLRRDGRFFVIYDLQKEKRKFIALSVSQYEICQFLAAKYLHLPDIPVDFPAIAGEFHKLYETYDKSFWNKKAESKLIQKNLSPTYFDSYDYLKPYNRIFELYVAYKAQPYFTEAGVSLREGTFFGFDTNEKTYLERDGEFLVVYYMERGDKNLIALFTDIKDALIFLAADALKLGTLPFDWDKLCSDFESLYGPIESELVMP